MKILYVHDALALWGGIERVFIEKMNYFVKEYGYDVFLLTANQGNHPFPFALDKRVHYEDLSVCTHRQYRYKWFRRYWERLRLNWKLRIRMAEKIQSINPDFIIATTQVYIPMLVKLKGNSVLIAESHSGYNYIVEYDYLKGYHRLPIIRKWEKNRLYRWLKKTDIIVALTENDAVCWRQIHANVKVIPNVVHLNTTGRYSSLENKTVIYAGRFAYQKGLPDLLEIWKLVHEKHPDWKLEMYGEGALKEDVMRVVKTRDYNISVFSPVPDILNRFIDSSVFVLTSYYEAFGLVLVEAMSCGLPVVVFDCPYGPPEIVTDCADGFLVSNRNIQYFADRICQLIEDKELRRKMGQQAVLSSQRYTEERVMPLWKELFESYKR